MSILISVFNTFNTVYTNNSSSDWKLSDIRHFKLSDNRQNYLQFIDKGTY